MTAPKTPELSGPVEDYLKVIFELEATDGIAGTNEIAAELDIAAASVSGMIRRLAKQGLIAHERYDPRAMPRRRHAAATPARARHGHFERFMLRTC